MYITGRVEHRERSQSRFSITSPVMNSYLSKFTFRQNEKCHLVVVFSTLPGTRKLRNHSICIGVDIICERNERKYHNIQSRMWNGDYIVNHLKQIENNIINNIMSIYTTINGKMSQNVHQTSAE